MKWKLVLILLLVIIIIISIYIYFRLKEPECGGYVDPSLRYCSSKSTIISGEPIPEEQCNIGNVILEDFFKVQFLNYIKMVYETIPQGLYNELYLQFSSLSTIYAGTMIFAINPLLKLLPSDFGQNEQTPYGVMSFFPVYMSSCIDNEEHFCSYLAKGHPGSYQFCKNLLDKYIDPNKKCPFQVNSKNPNLYISDVNFFDLVGTLGTFSLTKQQIVVTYYDFPVSQLNLNYWSFTLYMADRLSKEKCMPFRQTYLASLLQPLNCFTAVSNSKKKFNPFTGRGDLIQQGHIRFYVIVSLNQKLTSIVQAFLESRNDSDFIHVFQIPTYMSIDPSLPNPNNLTTKDLLYNPETDRLCMFLRLSPPPNVSETDQALLNAYIHYRPPFQNSLELCMLDFGDNAPMDDTIIDYKAPPYINPPFLENPNLISIHDNLRYTLSSNIYNNEFNFIKLQSRYTLLNIFSPLTSSILKTTTHDYQGGWQAIQMAGNAQGDNPDAQYRLSQGTCLSHDNVMIAVAVNHAYYGNSIYNNINIIDLNKAYSFYAVALNAEIDQEYYVVITGRNQGLLDKVHDIIASSMSRQLPNTKIGYYKKYIKTDSSVYNGVPLCHQIIMAERIYVNPQYPSIKNPSILYNLKNVFGNSFHDILNTSSEYDDMWDSMVNTNGPSVDTLIPPLYLKLKFPTYRKVLFMIATVIFVTLLLFTLSIYSKRRG